MSPQENSYRNVAALVLVSVLGLAGCGKTEQPSSKQGVSAPVTEKLTAPSPGGTCMNLKDITKKGPLYYCVSPDMVGQSLCLRQPFEDAKHVRELKFPPGSLPEGLITHVKQPNGTVANGSAIADGTLLPPPSPAPCGGRPIPFVDVNDTIEVLPNQAQTGLTLNIKDKNGHQKPHFPQALDLTPDPMGGHYFWKATSDGIDFFVMLEDADRGNPGSPGIPWLERYILVEAFWSDQSSDQKCEMRKPETPTAGSVAYNFFSWNGDQATCPAQGMTSENGTGAGGHNEP